MAKPKPSYRRRMIEAQDDRNRRLTRLTRQGRKQVRQLAKSVFCCRPCDREVAISWEKLNREGGTPKCRECGGTLQVLTPCLSKGVLPKLSTRTAA